MTSAAKRWVPALNTLIETCKDSERGFQAAASALRNPDVKKLFQTYAQQRARFVVELQDEVRQLGGDPEDHGTLTGVLHRGLLSLKAVVTGRDEATILAECERGEVAARQAYRKVLRRKLPESLRALLEHHYAGIKEAYRRIRALGAVVSAP